MKLYLFVFVTLLLLSSIIASEVDYEQVKQNTCIDLTQSNPNGTYMNLTSIKVNGDRILEGTYEMTKNGGEYNYTFCNTSIIGDYTWCIQTDVQGVDIPSCLGFKVTPTGFIGTLGLYIVFLVILGSICFAGFYIKEAWLVVMSGLGMMMLGLYSINYGVVGFRDMFMTWGIGLLEISVGAFLAVQGAIQKLYYD